MIVERRSSARLALLGFALALVLPIAACDTKEAPPVVVIPPAGAPAPIPTALGPDGKPITDPAAKPH